MKLKDHKKILSPISLVSRYTQFKSDHNVVKNCGIARKLRDLHVDNNYMVNV